MNLDNLKKKYKFPSKRPIISKSNIQMGWFTSNNIILLNKYLKNKCDKECVVLELGVWLGMSTRLIAHQISDKSTVICVDWWKGDSSIGNKSANENELYNRYINNVWDYKDKIIPVRMDGRAAIKYLYKMKIKVDLIYLDMGHSYKEVYGDLLELMKYYPEVIIVGDDYLYWSGVKKAVHEIRLKYNIPFLDVDKNCYALVPLKEEKMMTYNNDKLSNNINKLKKIVNKHDREKYKFEELQYSFNFKEIKCKRRVFIINIKENITNKLFKSNYKNIAELSNKDDIILFIKNINEANIYLIYNIGYLYYIKHYKEDATFFFIDNQQVIDSKSYKCIDGLLSITSLRDLSIDIYANHGTLSINKNTFHKLDGFPYINSYKKTNNYQTNNYLHRYFFYRKIINNKIIINQQYSKFYGNDINIKEVIVVKIGAIINNKNLINNKNYICTKCSNATKRYSMISDNRWIATNSNLFNNKLSDLKFKIISDTKLNTCIFIVVET